MKKKEEENIAIEWGITHQERASDHESRESRHHCKGRHCETAFEKL